MMTAEQAKAVITEMEAQVKSKAKRKQIAASFARNLFGKLSPEAIAIYRNYAETN